MRRVHVAVAGLLLVLAPGLLAEEPLAAAARKEQERRKKNHEAGVKAPVVDDEALRNGTGRLANDPNQPPAVEPDRAKHRVLAVPGATTGASAEPDSSREAPAWRDRIARAREKVDEAQKQFRYAEDMWLSHGAYSERKGEPVVTSDAVARGPVDRARKELEDAQAAYSTLEAEALRAGVPPASLR